MRVRENAESVAFYGGEDNEQRLLNSRLQGAVDNFLGGWIAGACSKRAALHRCIAGNVQQPH